MFNRLYIELVQIADLLEYEVSLAGGAVTLTHASGKIEVFSQRCAELSIRQALQWCRTGERNDRLQRPA